MTLTRPQPGPPPPFTPSSHEYVAFDNGARATLVQAGNVPLASVRLVVRAGSAGVPPELTWLDRLTHAYLEQGTERLDAAALADTIASMGGGIEIDSDEHTTVLRTEVLSEYAPDAVRLLSEVATEPRFDPADEARLLADQRRMLDLILTQPEVIAQAAFRRLLYGEHPYGNVLPDAAQIDALTVDAARRFWQRHVVSTGAHLMVAGRFDAAAVREAASDALDAWTPGEASAIAPPEPHRGRILRVHDRPGAEQTTLRIGLPVIDPAHDDYVALEVTNALLGGSFHSRITQNIREQKGYTYSPRSSISARPGDAYWSESADVTTNVTGPALDEIVAEIERLTAEPPPEGELDGIKNYVAGTFVIRQATASAILDSLEFLNLHGLDESYTASYIDRVRAVTPQDVQRLAATYLPAAEMAIVAVGDRSAIEEQLRPFGDIEEAAAQ